MIRWVGRWIMVVGVIHCLVGGIALVEPLHSILQAGIWNAVHGDILRQLAAWFEVTGLLTILFGALVDWVENEVGHFPPWLGYGFLLIMLLVIAVQPTGGGWLLLPAAVGLWFKRQG